MDMTVSLLARHIAAIARSNQGNTFLRELLQAGVHLPDLATLKEPNVSREVLADEGLCARLGQALDRTSDRSIVTPPREETLPSWPEEVTRHFGEGPIEHRNLPLTRLWRSVRKFSKGRFVSDYSEAASPWVQALEYHQMVRLVGPADQGCANDQILHWLGIKKVPHERRVRDLRSLSLGFEELEHDPFALPDVPLKPGDLVTYSAPVSAGAAVLTKVTPEGCPAEVLFLIGGSLCLGHPDLPGKSPAYHRPEGGRPDYLIVSRSRYDDPSVRLVPDLDTLLEVEGGVRFDRPEFQVVEQDSGPSGSKWAVSYQFTEGDRAILHLAIERRKETRNLSVVIDYNSDGKGPEEAKRRLVRFNAVVEKLLSGVAGSIGFDRLDLFYKSAIGGGDELTHLGYRRMTSPEWGRLPGKRLKVPLRKG